MNRANHHIVRLLPVCAVAALSTGRAVAQDGDTPVQSAFVSVVANSDVWESSANVPVRIEGGSGLTYDQTTDADGQTEFVQVAPGEPLVVTLGEHALPLGIALGQTRLISGPQPVSDADDVSLVYETTQPLAVPFVWDVSSSGDEVHQVTASPYHDRWALTSVYDAKQFGADVTFSGYLASLLTPNVISSFAWYNDIAFGLDADDFRVGVVMRTADVDVPNASFTLEIDCSGHGFTAPPIASCFIVHYGDTSDLPQPTLTASVVRWTNERAYVWIQGALESADNVILLSPSAALPTQRLEATPPSFAGTDAAGQDCIPDPPTPPSGWTCLPAGPWTPPCKAPKLIVLGCGTTTRKISQIVCGSGGDSRDQTTEFQAGGGITVGGSLFGLDIEVTGEISATKSETLTVTLNDGANKCGECKAQYEHILICRAVWAAEDASVIMPHPMSMREPTILCKKKIKSTVCHDKIPTTSPPCSRTCN